MNLPSNSRWEDYDPERSAYPPPAALSERSIPEVFVSRAKELDSRCLCTTRTTESDRSAGSADWRVTSWSEACLLLRRAVEFLRGSLALKPSARVLLISPGSFETLIVDLAAQVAGAVPVLLPDRVTSEVLERERPAAAVTYRSDFLEELSAHASSRIAAGGEPLHVLVLHADAPPDQEHLRFHDWSDVEGTEPAEELPLSSSDVSVVHYERDLRSSLALSHEQVLRMIDAFILSDLLGPAQHLMPALPYYSVLGRTVVLTALALEGSLTFTSPGASVETPRAAAIAELFSDLRNGHPRALFCPTETLDRLCAAFVSSGERRSGASRLLKLAREAAGAPECGLLRRVLGRFAAARLRRSLFGKRVEAVGTFGTKGAAAASRELLNVLTVPRFEGFAEPAFGLPVSANTPGASRDGSLGRRFLGVRMEKKGAARWESIPSVETQLPGMEPDEDGFLRPSR